MGVVRGLGGGLARKLGRSLLGMLVPMLLLAAAARVEAQTLIYDRFENQHSAPTGWALLTSVSATETPTTTPTGTPTLTPTPNGELGALCAVDTLCDSGFCVDGVCCERECELPEEICNAPGQEGTCVPRPGVGAPAVSHKGLVLMVLALGGLAALQLRRSLHAG